jgi:hypothetical protein
MKVSASNLRQMIELAPTHSREEIAVILGISPHTAKKMESRMREWPDAPRCCLSICPMCNVRTPPEKRYAMKTSRSLYCVACYTKAHPNSDPQRIRTANSKIGVTDPLPNDTMTMSVRRKLKSQIQWSHGSFGSLSPGYSAMPDGWFS